MAEHKYRSVREALPRILINLSGRPAVVFIRWFFIFAILYTGFPHITTMIHDLAGKKTSAEFGLDLGETGASCDCSTYLIVIAIAALLAVGSVVYGKREHREKQKFIERADKRIKFLERSLDEKRSSSGLTPKGETNPEDR